MNPFWGNVWDYVKDRRYAMIFFGTLLALVGLLIAGLILCQVFSAYHLEDYLENVLPGLSVLFLLWLWRQVRRVQARRRERKKGYKISPLSRDELNKARSKLIRAKP
jgi:hypothetical protein